MTRASSAKIGPADIVISGILQGAKLGQERGSTDDCPRPAPRSSTHTIQEERSCIHLIAYLAVVMPEICI